MFVCKDKKKARFFRNISLRKKLENIKTGENVERGRMGCEARTSGRRSWQANQTMWGGNKQQIDAEINLQWENEERKTQELLFLAQLIGEM